MNDKIDMNIAHWAAICENLNEELSEEETDQRAILNSAPSQLKDITTKIKELNGALKSKLALSLVGDLAEYFEEKSRDNRNIDQIAVMCKDFCKDFYHEAFQLAKDQKL